MSGNDTSDSYDLTEVIDGADAGASVPDGDLLNAFCEAIIQRDADRTATVRQQIVDKLGELAMTDAAATIAAFNAYPRAADATGLPLEDQKAALTDEMRAQLGLNSLDVAHRSAGAGQAAE